MRNTYYKNDYSKREVNVIEITQTRLQKMKINLAMASFYCLVSKIWKKGVFSAATKKENTPVCAA